MSDKFSTHGLAHEVSLTILSWPHYASSPPWSPTPSLHRSIRLALTPSFEHSTESLMAARENAIRHGVQEPAALDSVLRVAGRFDLELRLDPPGAAARRQLLVRPPCRSSTAAKHLSSRGLS